MHLRDKQRRYTDFGLLCCTAGGEKDAREHHANSAKGQNQLTPAKDAMQVALLVICAFAARRPAKTKAASGRCLCVLNIVEGGRTDLVVVRKEERKAKGSGRGGRHLTYQFI